MTIANAMLCMLSEQNNNVQIGQECVPDSLTPSTQGNIFTHTHRDCMATDPKVRCWSSVWSSNYMVQFKQKQ